MTGAGSGGQGPPDGTDAEEAERCPICLGVLAGGELAMPDSCCHVFCLRCLLTWAELQMAPSCPVDRRPFTNVYRWDGNLSCVQVPVRKRVTQPEAESCCCRTPEQKVCLKSKPARRLRRQKVERMADAKTKGLVRKCNDDDPSSLSRKKVRGTECCTWSPSPCVSLTTLTQDIAEPVWVTEDIPYDTGFKQCKPQMQDCPWLSPAAPIPATGTSRQNFHPSGWNHSPSPSLFTSTSLFGPGHFVFQGVVCAITCPKGGEKRGGRASTSKAPPKEAKSLPSRRSGRNNKSQEEVPASDPSSPPQSSSSDGDSSAKPGRASQAPAKRKGKQVTNRKASGKRKATTRRKKSPEVVSSPAASEEEEGEEEEEGDGCDSVTTKVEEGDKSDQEDDLKPSEQQPSDAEVSLNEDQDGFNSADEPGGAEPSGNDVGQDSDETQEQLNRRQPKPGKGDDDMSCPSDSAPYSPGSCSEGDQSKRGEEEEEEEEPASPVSSCGGKDSEDRASPSPSDSENALQDHARSPQRDEQPERDEDTARRAGSEEANNEASPKEAMAESCEDSPPPASPSAGESEDDSAVPDSKASEDADVKPAGSEEPPVVDRSGEGTKEDSPSKDDTKVVPMDCSSPTSEHGSSPILELLKENAVPAAAEPPAAAGRVAKDESYKEQPERERSQERKNGRQRRSRFHSPTSKWSPKRESKRETSRRSRSRSREPSRRSRSREPSRRSRSRSREPSRRSRSRSREPSRRSRSRERDGSPPSSRSSRARSRERDRERDGERDHSKRERSRERRRRRSKSRSKSRSRSRSRSRTRAYRRGPSPDRPASREQSPQRKERRGGWRAGQGSGSAGEGPRHHGGAGRFENGGPTESSPERQAWSENPDWVTEKTREVGAGSRWEDRNSGGNRGESRGRGGRGGFERGRGAGRGGGGGNRSFFNQQEETADSRWQPRNNFSGTGNVSGNDAYSRFNENRGGGRRKESDPGDYDRSGWSSASSWAVRRTLPADVQDYYSKRERGGPGGWSRQEEEQPGAAAASDPAKSEPPPQAVPGNAPVPVMNVIPAQLNVLHHHYPMQGPRGALPVSLQPAAPYAMPPQVPVHLHPAVPLLQVPAVGAQGLPPPPPPPPPMHQGSLTAAAQPDGYTTQIQEKAVNEVKNAIKPYYQKKEITKDEYKEIVRKAVEKVCHSKSGEVNSSKVANLVKAYVDKYKHARKK
ncbi:protein SCAF11 isoform X4 [Perca fluviatilis]|uniref:protein SCAF11 isoform X4 n=1 Tax=Perca fluviatilis TaxID=8168 RepID=UPI001963F7BF|nr:protein SCAF11 isoform X4 [Perca fluviatilis]